MRKVIISQVLNMTCAYNVHALGIVKQNLGEKKMRESNCIKNILGMVVSQYVNRALNLFDILKYLPGRR